MSTTPAGRVYVPGYRWSKALMIAAGIGLCVFGASQLWPSMRLMLFGKRAHAEAVWVLKTKEGLPPLMLKTDAEIDAQRETRDRSYVFWNVFKFSTADGRSIIARAGAGSEFGPIYRLLDEDGLPASALVYYDPADPQKVAFPLIVSTWLSAAVILLAGLLAVVIGAVLYHWANTPIEMPHIPTLGEIESTHRRESTPSSEDNPQ